MLWALFVCLHIAMVHEVKPHLNEKMQATAIVNKVCDAIEHLEELSDDDSALLRQKLGVSSQNFIRHSRLIFDDLMQQAVNSPDAPLDDFCGRMSELFFSIPRVVRTIDGLNSKHVAYPVDPEKHGGHRYKIVV